MYQKTAPWTIEAAPRVTMKAGAAVFATIAPLAAPIKRPRPSGAITAKRIEPEPPFMIPIVSVSPIDITAATERSMPPRMITPVWPIATIASGTACLRMFM